MSITPMNLTLEQAALLIQQGDCTQKATVKEALAYVIDGDIWQDGKAWRGPRPSGNAPGDVLVNDEIKRGLAAVNLAQELVVRHVDGCIAKEPVWSLVGVNQADQEALTQWWDQRKVMSLVRKALSRALCGDEPVIRLLITQQPSKILPTLNSALNIIALEVLDSSTARVIENPAANIFLGVTVYDAAARTLSGLLGRASMSRTAEIVFLDPEGSEATVMLSRGDNFTEANEPIFLPLGQRLMMHSVQVPPLLNMSLCGIQGLLTLTLSSMGRNMQSAGFVERVMLNAQRPTKPDGTPSVFQVGPGITNWLVGVPGADGVPVTPSMYVRSPEAPTAFSTACETLVYHGHKEARQLHALISGDATASGESRQQAASDFEASLGPTVAETQLLLRWLLETVYALALYLQGKSLHPQMRANVTLRLSSSIPTVAKMVELRTGAKEGYLSAARYLAAMGADDPKAELEEIQTLNADMQAARLSSTPTLTPTLTPVTVQDAVTG